MWRLLNLTRGFRLDMAGKITVTNTDSDLFICEGGEAKAEAIRVTNGAKVRLETGGLINADQLHICYEGFLVGACEVNVQTELENDGAITASDSVRTITTSNMTGVFDLDGYASTTAGRHLTATTIPNRSRIAVEGSGTASRNTERSLEKYNPEPCVDSTRLAALSMEPTTSIRLPNAS